MLTTKNGFVLAVVGCAFLAAGCQDTNTTQGFAVYTYSAGPYRETVTLRPDGKYVQSEAQKGNSAIPGEPSPSLPLKLKQTGTWRLLDGPGGKPLPLSGSPDALPRTAIVELHNALPFGLTWENQSPATLRSSRTIPAGDFIIQPHAH